MSKYLLAGAIFLLLAGCGGGSDSGSSTPATQAVTAPNRAPVVASANPDQTATVGVAFQYDASRAGAVFTDADGNTLSYRLTIAPATSGLSISATTVSGTPTTAGTYRVTITADDGRGGTASDDFDIVVAPPPNQPVLPATSFQYSDAGIALPRQFTTVPGNPSAEDNTPANNPVSNAGATLGRVLFYD